MRKRSKGVVRFKFKPPVCYDPEESCLKVFLRQIGKLALSCRKKAGVLITQCDQRSSSSATSVNSVVSRDHSGESSRIHTLRAEQMPLVATTRDLDRLLREALSAGTLGEHEDRSKDDHRPFGHRKNKSWTVGGLRLANGSRLATESPSSFSALSECRALSAASGRSTSSLKT